MEKLPLDVGIENKTVVLMLTCKKFNQLWNPFFILLKKYWPECPYKIIMGTDIGTYPGIETIQVGKDLGWTNNCINILNQVQAERIILFFDDFLPNDKFNNDTIRKLVRYSMDNDIGCLRLCPCPGPTKKWKDKFVGELQVGDPYRLSLQTAIWKKSLLLSLLKSSESAWETEIKGTIRTYSSKEIFLSVWRKDEANPGSPTPYIITAVVKGVWIDSAIEFLKKEGIPTDKITKIII